jgi:hypothetical protein
VSLDRRRFLRGLIAAPAIIKLAPLMKIKPLEPGFLPWREFDRIYRTSLPQATWRMLYQGALLPVHEPINALGETGDLLPELSPSPEVLLMPSLRRRLPILGHVFQKRDLDR